MSAPLKKERKLSNIFWRIIISATGAALMLIAVSNLSLYFFGEKAEVSVTTRRVGGADNQYDPSKRYEWSVDYTFTDKNGDKHNGHTTRRGGDMGVKTDNKVYYFSFAPFINALESDATPNIGQPLFVVIGVFLIIVINKNNKKTRPATVPQKSGDLKDYDDSAKELFHQDE